jgi:hypothetical protein
MSLEEKINSKKIWILMMAVVAFITVISNGDDLSHTGESYHQLRKWI